MTESIARATLGPTPLTAVRVWNRPRSSPVAKPYSVMPSSRTTRWVCSMIAAPVFAPATVPAGLYTR